MDAIEIRRGPEEEVLNSRPLSRSIKTQKNCLIYFFIVYFHVFRLSDSSGDAEWWSSTSPKVLGGYPARQPFECTAASRRILMAYTAWLIGSRTFPSAAVLSAPRWCRPHIWADWLPHRKGGITTANVTHPRIHVGGKLASSDLLKTPIRNERGGGS